MSITSLVRRWFPCFRREHPWRPATDYSHYTDGILAYTMAGRRCDRCLKFEAQWIDEMHPISSPRQPTWWRSSK